ncbi:type II toxin-antitoxin system RelE/ParE family toxin [Thalassotalea sp. G20_0]|uniref:type II toxin-antitoxin system RelE/ParE family toxin n=1 Tax=Thalassotalea sp. G20_0 TaxID=2821093 RepID=UPI001ADAD5BD|nr:type II toxin-antitoxin system RelE/ParE family toxin [Thalassotalea sp. G20_0]MBO9496748.1 type II toxin-antitoxin system RelE/ParE family toxin [Thalassotalea sp. G20_0]
MIISFLHKGLERFYRTGKTSGIQAQHARKLQRILTNLDELAHISEMDFPGYRLHQLKGERQGIWSVTVSGNWRVTFRLTQAGVEIVNYEDYH